MLEKNILQCSSTKDHFCQINVLQVLQNWQTGSYFSKGTKQGYCFIDISVFYIVSEKKLRKDI